MFSERHDDIDWEFVKRLSALARANGIGYLFSHRYARQQINVPLNVAEYVLENCHLHNSQFVSLCERAFRSHVAQGAKRVSSVAEEEMWFVSDEE